MVFDSTLDLKTLLWGLELQHNIWILLTGLGFLWLPMLWHVGETILLKPAIEASEYLALRTGLFLFMITLAGTPMILFDASTLVYEDPNCPSLSYSPDAGAYAEVEANAEGVKVSYLVAMTMGIGNGINKALIAAIGCNDDTRFKLSLALQEQVHSPLMSDEVNQFLRDCHAPAKSQFYNESALNQGVSQEATPDDWLWAFYLDTPGYYDSLRAAEPVGAIEFDPARDIEAGLDPSQGGLPFCNEWFFSLRERLLLEMDPAALEEVRMYGESIDDVWGVENSYLYHIVMNTVLTTTGSADQSIMESVEDQIASGGYGLSYYDGSSVATDLWATVGSWIASAVAYPWLAALKEALPLTRALLLFTLVLAYMPLVIFSGFKLSTLVMWSVAIVVVSLWGSVWAAVSVLENMLARVFFPDPQGFLGTATAALHDIAWRFQRLIFDVVFGLAMLLIPLYMLKLPNWAGVHVGELGGLVGSLTHDSSGSVKDGAGSATRIGTGKVL